jgi:hypothetical protein
MPELGATLVRVDSAEEQYAYMLSRFGDPDGWSVTSQMFDVASDGRDVEHVDIQPVGGAPIRVTFVSARDDAFFDGPVVDEDATQFLDRMMEAASTFSMENPPHHPGTLARFPVPSASYANALALPMPVVAVDSGRRGLYAPPRVVVIDNATGEAKGVGEFPGFDPEHWPPPRLGDWPPPSIRAMHRLQLQGTIMRFSALWNRVLRAWFAKDIMDSPDLTSDVQEALTMRARLDLPAMLPYYDRLNPVFAKWLARRAEPD